MTRRRLWVIAAAALALAVALLHQPINRWIVRGITGAGLLIERSVRSVAPGPDRPPAQLPAPLELAPAALWVFDPRRQTTDPVVTASGEIITSTGEALVALSAEGRERWRVQLPVGTHPGFSQPVATPQGRIAVVVFGTHLALFDSAGAPIWQQRIAREHAFLSSITTLEDGGLVVGELRSTSSIDMTWRSIAVDPQGAIRWTLDRGHDKAIPMPGGGVALRIAGRLWLFDAKGERRPADAPVAHPRLPFAVGPDGVVYRDAASGGRFGAPLSRLPSASGLPRRELCSERRSVTLGPNGAIYVACVKALHALREDGSLLWRREMRWLSALPPRFGADGTLYVVGKELHAFSPAGDTVWHTRLWHQHRSSGPPQPIRPAEISAGPLIGPDGTVYLGAHENRVYAVTPDGRLRWVYAIGEEDGSDRTVTNLSWLNDALLVSAGSLIALPVPGARLESVTGEKSGNDLAY